MKKWICVLLASLLLVGTLAACGSKNIEPSNRDYAEVLTEVQGDTAGPNIISSVDDPMFETIPSFMGLAAKDMDRFAISVSMINVQAYCLAIILPAEGQAETVIDALKAFQSQMEKSFENYTPDQYAIAKAAIIKQLPSGEILFAMSEDAPDMISRMEKALAA